MHALGRQSGERMEPRSIKAMKILLAVDGSEPSEEAVKAVVERPWPTGTVVRVMHAVSTPTPPVVGEITYMSQDVAAVQQEDRMAGEEVVTRVANSLDAGKLKVETALREGKADVEIVEEAKEWGADLIMIGSHGYTGLKRLVLGSVAQSVVGRAPCSVEVVRRKET
jgi:nucleotide-binding universal stress UspA family protein